MAEDETNGKDANSEGPSTRARPEVVDPHRKEMEDLARFLGVSPDEARAQVMSHTASVLGLAHPGSEMSFAEKLTARSWAWNLAVFAIRHGLTDDDVVVQWRDEAGDAWSYAHEREEELLAQMAETSKKLTSELANQLPLDNIVGRNIAEMLLGAKATGAAAALGRIPSVTGLPFDNIKRLQGLNRDLASHSTLPDLNLVSPKLDDALANVYREQQERREKEEQWRENVVDELALIAASSATSNEKLDKLVIDSGKVSKMTMRFGVATVGLMIITLVVAILAAIWEVVDLSPWDQASLMFRGRRWCATARDRAEIGLPSGSTSPDRLGHPPQIPRLA